MPEKVVRPMRELMRVFEELDGHTFQYQFKGIIFPQPMALDLPLAAPVKI